MGLFKINLIKSWFLKNAKDGEKEETTFIHKMCLDKLHFSF